MPRSERDVMWAAALSVDARTGRRHVDEPGLTASGWQPATDVFEAENGLLVVVALPGVRREDMEIIIVTGELLVRGTRRWPTLPRPARAHRVELPHGRFERRLLLPPGAYRLERREHVDGCLLLTLQRIG